MKIPFKPPFFLLISTLISPWKTPTVTLRTPSSETGGHGQAQSVAGTVGGVVPGIPFIRIYIYIVLYLINIIS